MYFVLICALCAAAARSAPQTFVVTNHQNEVAYTQELVRLQVDIRGANASAISVLEDGVAVPYQVEVLSSTAEHVQAGYLWVATTLAPLANHTYTVDTAAAPPAAGHADAAPLVTVTQQGDSYILSNSLVSVRAPAVLNSAGVPPPPLQGVTLLSGAGAGEERGNWSWQLPAAPVYTLTAFSATVSASGPLFGEVALLYNFSSSDSGGSAGFASWRVRLLPAQWGPQVYENHSLSIDAAVDARLDAGWKQPPTQYIANPWFYCDRNLPIDPNGALIQNDTQLINPLQREARLPGGVFGYIQPRWSQSCDSRWYWSVSDGASSLGIMAARPSLWRYPQWRSMDYYTMRQHLFNVYSTQDPTTGGDNGAALHSPLYGARWYYILAAPANAVTGAGVVSLSLSYAMQELDRLINTYILDWPGTQPAVGGFTGWWFYNETTNPTGSLRQMGKALLSSLAAGKPPTPGRALLSIGQVFCDPDWYAAYWGLMAPENNNFNTDFMVLCLGYIMAIVAGGHPQSSTFATIASEAWQSDLFHSVAMPGPNSPPAARGGAGSESPGYTGHAMSSWLLEAPLLKQYLNYNAPAEPRFLAAVDFFYHCSQPWAFHFLGPAAANNSDVAGGRYILPLGDTHPGSVNFSQVSGLSGVPLPTAAELQLFVSEEYPGYGVFLRSQGKTGTPEETFFALKASPNRGHNHGDQLAFHYAAYGARIAIDIQAGYNPRPYQESWHNRLAFGNITGNTTINMDGYERLTGFTTSAVADVAIGEVSSYRLQQLPANPPQIYDAVYPVYALPGVLTYRRTAVLVKGPTGGRDYVVLIDAHNASSLPPPPPPQQGGLSALPGFVAFTYFQQDQIVAQQLGPNSMDLGNSTLYTFAATASSTVPVPVDIITDRWNWPSEGNENATRVRVLPSPAAAQADEVTYFVSVMYPAGSLSVPVTASEATGRSAASAVPAVTFTPASTPGGTASLTVQFAGGSTDVFSMSGLVLDAGAGPSGGSTVLLSLTRDGGGGGGGTSSLLTAEDVSLGRSQGDIGLETLDVGYTFGEEPAWLLDARAGPDLASQPYLWPPNQALANLNCA